MPSTVSQQLADLFGQDIALPTEGLDEYAIDGVTPGAVAKPSNRDVVAEIMRWAASERVSVFPRGGGTQIALGNVPDRVDLVLDLSSLCHVLDYQPADLTVTVEAGIPLRSLQKALAQGGKYLPLEAPLADQATVGGIIAASTSGPLRFSYGSPRDWLIGISVVGASGVETKAGGRVVKNVTGYDLNKLYAGSLGTLGVIVEANFKLSPLAADSGAIAARFPSLPEGIGAVDNLLRQVYAPLGVQLMDGRAARQLDGDVSVAVADGLEIDGSVAVAFYAGRPSGLKRRLDEGKRSLAESGATDLVTLGQDETATTLEQLTDLGWSHATLPYLAIKASVPPSKLAQLVERCHQEVAMGLPPGVIAYPGVGIVRLLWWADTISDWVEDSLVFSTIAHIREQVQATGGLTVVERCPLPLKKLINVWGEAPPGLDIMRNIKERLDPLGVLSPGRFVGGI